MNLRNVSSLLFISVPAILLKEEKPDKDSKLKPSPNRVYWKGPIMGKQVGRLR
jgi:hypothetical protein